MLIGIFVFLRWIAATPRRGEIFGAGIRLASCSKDDMRARFVRAPALGIR
jgi:hypothetical protein